MTKCKKNVNVSLCFEESTFELYFLRETKVFRGIICVPVNRTVRTLGVLSGELLLKMTRDEIRMVCPEEGARVFFQLQAVKSSLAVRINLAHINASHHHSMYSWWGEGGGGRRTRTFSEDNLLV